MTVPLVAVLGTVKVPTVEKAPVSNWMPPTAPGVKAFITVSLVTECCIESELVTVTVVPAATERLAGLYWKLEMAMVFGGGGEPEEEEEPQWQASVAIARADSVRRVRISVRGSLPFGNRDTAHPRALRLQQSPCSPSGPFAA